VSLNTLGWNSFFEQQLTSADPQSWTPARVVWQGRGAYRLSAGGDEWLAALAGRLRHEAASGADLPTVGDWVLAESGIIHRLLTRRTAFSRKIAGRASDEQIVAANVDTVLLVTSLNRDFNPRRLERYLMLAWESGANPFIVLNKADLCEDAEGSRRRAESAAAGVGLLVTSAVRGDGLGELAQIVTRGGTTALLGSSGVGKSSLINALLGERRQAVLGIREQDGRGRHSTTARQLFLAPGGGVLIDTPGMRELQLWDAEDGLEHAFSDINTLAEHCRFRDCSHHREPGCAVKAAVAGGQLDPSRLDSYQRLKREERYLRAREEEGHPERGRGARAGSKALKQLYKLRRR
jgi:ribosome biogenesis GTPase / thiamine phosphate phosphatase